MIVIPAIDIKDGNCVRLLRGDFNQQTEYSSNPAAVADDYRQMGFSHLHLVDLDGAKSGAQANRTIVSTIAAEGDFEIQLGGGIRELSTLRNWLDTGVRRCVVGSMAVTDSDTVVAWLNEFGGDSIVLALDVRIDKNGVPRLATHGWTQSSELSLWDCISRYAGSGIRHILCTDISRDGAMAGPNLALYEDFVRRFPDILLQASGGVRDIRDLHALRHTGAAAAITGRALLDDRIAVEELSPFLQNA